MKSNPEEMVLACKCPVCAAFLRRSSDCPRCHGTMVSPVMYRIHPTTKDWITSQLEQNGVPEIATPLFWVDSSVSPGRVDVMAIPLNLIETMWMAKQPIFQMGLNRLQMRRIYWH